MNEHCGFQLFEDCNCKPGECRSANVPVIQVLTALQERAERDHSLASVNTLEAWLIALVSLSMLTLACVEMGRGRSIEMAKINQEQVAWTR